MALPKVGYPTFELELPSTGKTVKYRPFLVKEEKVLLLALETQDEKEVLNAVKDLIKNCVISRIKVDALPSFDLEYLFLKIRAASIGELITLTVTCQDDNETKVLNLNLDFSNSGNNCSYFNKAIGCSKIKIVKISSFCTINEK